MSCAGRECGSIVNSTNLLVNTTGVGDCTAVAVKCPVGGQRLANMVGVYTCHDGVWNPFRPRSCLGLYRERNCADTVGTVLVPWADHFQNAKIQIYFSNEIYGSNFFKQHSETVMILKLAEC